MDVIRWLTEQSAPILTTLAAILSTVIAWIAARSSMRHKSFITYVVNGLLYGAIQFSTRNAAAYFSLKRYCRIHLNDTKRYLHVPGAKDVNLDIDKIFVPLILTEGGARKNYDHATLISGGEHDEERRRIRIIGDPGSGKSSIAKRIFRDACLKGVSSPTKARFPVLIELGKVRFNEATTTKSGENPLLTAVRNEVQSDGVYEIEKCLDAFTKSTGVLLILDGLDEVASEDYRDAERSINDLCHSLEKLGPENVVILTMRIQFHQQVRNDYQEAIPTVLQLKPFSPRDIYTFLTRWDFDESERSTQIIRIYNELNDRPALREMCANPLILAMYVAHDQTHDHPIAPESRTEFYGRVTDELLVARRLRTHTTTMGRVALLEQRQKILGQIALTHLLDQSQPANLISWAQAVSIVSEITGMSDPEAEEAFKIISTETGIITQEKEGETCCFIHLTFCEFLAANEATEAGLEGWGALLAGHKQFAKSALPAERTRLLEVLPFACALMRRHMKVGALSDLSEVDNPHMLALAFLETKSYDHPLWSEFLASEKKRLIARKETVVRKGRAVRSAKASELEMAKRVEVAAADLPSRRAMHSKALTDHAAAAKAKEKAQARLNDQDEFLGRQNAGAVTSEAFEGASRNRRGRWNWTRWASRERRAARTLAKAATLAKEATTVQDAFLLRVRQEGDANIVVQAASQAEEAARVSLEIARKALEFAVNAAGGLEWEADRERTDWLNELHLFVVVSVDAERKASLTRKILASSDLDEFIQELAGSTADTLFDLIGDYAKQDAVAAFRVASLCNVDVLRSLADVIVKSCDQAPFLAMVLDQAAKEPDRLQLWSCAIAEASLTSPPVARSLHLNAVTLWRRLADGVGRSRRWFVEPLIPRTALTECMTYALADGAIDPQSLGFQRLEYVRSNAPLGSNLDYYIARVPLSGVVLFWLVYTAFVILMLFDVQGFLQRLFEFSTLARRLIIIGLFLGFFFLLAVTIYRSQLTAKLEYYRQIFSGESELLLPTEQS
jgi:hypothetical protein